MSLLAIDGYTPSLAPDCWAAANATLIGRVRIASQASVWFNAVLRGDQELIDIGERSNVQDGCVLHTDMGFPLDIGADCTVGHNVILHSCTIGENSLIGMGATILNGAKIGKNCLVGANALVTEAKVFPDNSLIVGAPAQVKRELDPGALQRHLESARHYVENARRYAHGLRPTPGA